MTEGARRSLLSLAGTGGRWPVALPWGASLLLAAATLVEGTFPFPLRLLIWAGLAVFTVLSMTAWVRWLHATRRTGVWAVLGVIPVVGALALPATLLWRRRPSPPERFAPRLRYKLGTGLILLSGAFVLSRVFWAPYTIPSESMAPTLLPGDYVLATGLGPWRRGDVVVFRHPASGQDYVKRIIALPGETFEMRDGVPVIDGNPVAQIRASDDLLPFFPLPHGGMPVCTNLPTEAGDACIRHVWDQTLPGGTEHAVFDVWEGPNDNVAPVTVPADHVIVLGDHRDNSADSRVPLLRGGLGPLPMDSIRAKVRRVVFNTQESGRIWIAVP